MNVASGEPISLRELIGQIEERIDGRGVVDFGARATPAGEPPVLLADVADSATRSASPRASTWLRAWRTRSPGGARGDERGHRGPARTARLASPPDLLDTSGGGRRRHPRRRGPARRLRRRVVLGLAAAPLLVRHLGVVDFGRYTLVLSLMALVQGVTEGGLSAIGLREYACSASVARHDS